MGCDDRESNFQRNIYVQGKWMGASGYSPSWEGPVEALRERFPDYDEPSFTQVDREYAVEHLSDAVVRVKPIGGMALRAAQL